jgi:hypothetical protein
MDKSLHLYNNLQNYTIDNFGHSIHPLGEEDSGSEKFLLIVFMCFSAGEAVEPVSTSRKFHHFYLYVFRTTMLCVCT